MIRRLAQMEFAEEQRVSNGRPVIRIFVVLLKSSERRRLGFRNAAGMVCVPNRVPC